VAATLEWSRRQYAALQGRREAGATGKGPSVQSAVDEYVKARKGRSIREGTLAEGRLRRHVLADDVFAKTPLAKLRASTFETWRSGLAVRQPGVVADASAQRSIAPATVNRILNDLRAALNAAAERYRREIPAATAAEIKVGTRALSITQDARKQLLTDEQTRQLVRAAFEQADDGDFGRLAMLAAATGARYSQLRAMRVADVQVERARVMVPGSHKGRSARQRPHISVPVAPEVIERLAPCLERRSPDDPLLTRWAYKNVAAFQWERDHRRAWGPAYEVEKFWSATVDRSGAPAGTIMYAFRHSSIVRGLRAGLPVRLVAALHDTSSEMIETHYSAHIIDATEELARRATLQI
jgi:integrase